MRDFRITKAKDAAADWLGCKKTCAHTAELLRFYRAVGACNSLKERGIKKSFRSRSQALKIERSLGPSYKERRPGLGLGLGLDLGLASRSVGPVWVLGLAARSVGPVAAGRRIIR
jgi:hypothetical protein